MLLRLLLTGLRMLQAFQQLQQASRPDGPRVRQRWAALLRRPGPGKLGDACELLSLVRTQHVAAEAETDKALQAFQQLQQASRPDDPRVRQRWAALLLRPGLGKLGDACELLVQAAAAQLKAQGTQQRPGWPSVAGKLPGELAV